MKKLNNIDKAMLIITIVTLLVAGFAICVGLDLINIGDTGIIFNF